MAPNVWSRVSTILEKSTINKPVPQRVIIETGTIRTILGVSLFQSVIMGLVFSIRDGIGTALLIPVFTLLQVGWFWDKVLFTWGESESGDNSCLADSNEVPQNSMFKERKAEPTGNSNKPPSSPFVSKIFPVTGNSNPNPDFTGSIAEGYGIKTNPVLNV